MKKLLSQGLAERSKPDDKPYQIHDTAIPGLVLRVQPTGTKVWKLIQKRKPQTLGRMPVMTFAMAKAQAERILRGEADQPSRVPMTFDSFLEKHYEPFVRANHANPDDTLNRLYRFRFGEKLLEEIKLADIETWRTKRQQDGRAATTINRDTGALGAAFSKAVEWDLLGVHPMAKFKALRVDKLRKPRSLGPNEEAALYAALSARDEYKRTSRQSANKWRKERNYQAMPDLGAYCDRLTPMVMLAINTGLRRGELWNLKWGDVDFREKMLTVHGLGAKSGQTRHVPLNAVAFETINIHRGEANPGANELVFGKHEFIKTWNRVLRKAGIQNFRFHDLRHTFASKLVSAGVPLNTVRELMGHSNLEMTLIYAHLAPENLRDAVDKI
ncbi:tyrosine-type recombinase/integrase [Marinihelvus fidelis]|uniref:Tyrosine-type recombinase/integrase n=1 Tax=Marinihelvus fidelis TaxID=2613842 RepID=A0A5N0T631_9GAMM|nr:tyrosine-type recombinase/integrase [Marinihelvus fidelis]KAA9130322.1 tyrosine-type recombinase/integrase [Marinihelvus fidelis]